MHIVLWTLSAAGLVALGSFTVHAIHDVWDRAHERREQLQSSEKRDHVVLHWLLSAQHLFELAVIGVGAVATWYLILVVLTASG